MRTIVSKFGGTSTAGADQFRRVLAIVRASPARRCVVLSAPGAEGKNKEKVTALLEKCWDARGDRAAFERAVSAVARRFSDISRELGLRDFGGEAEDEIIRAAIISHDHLLSRGEYLCAALFSRYSGIPTVDASEVVFFDEGGIDEARTAEAFRRLAVEYERVVMPGFYGMGPDGAIKVFPRNGSDISGALAAAGMGAGLYENWTDVPGLMTADPSVVPNARLIPQIGYRQMRALARAGARVLHPACLDPVAMAGIPTRLRCTWTPASFGTLVDDACGAVAKCVAGRRVSNERVGMSEISVFGVGFGKVRDVIKADVIQENEMCTRIYVEPERYEMTMRYLHRELIETCVPDGTRKEIITSSFR